MTTMISSVPREHIANIWQAISPDLDKAISRTHGRFHNVDILTALLEGEASLWVAIRDGKEIIGSLVFVVSIYPGGVTVGRIDYIAGRDRNDWFEEMWDAIVRYAKDNHCTVIEMVARPGTAQYVDKWGGKRVGILMEYDLKEDSDGR